MDSISRLREALLHALTGRIAPHGEQDIFDELMVHKSRLLQVFDVGPRSPQQQKELESGKVTIHGKSVAVNVDFTRQVLFLSQHLECSERYVAELLHSVMSENPNVGPADYLEATLNEFHQRRRHLVDTLRFLLEAAEVGASASDALPMYRRIEAFVRSEMIGVLPSRVFKEVDSLGGVLTKVDGVRRNAGSNTVPPNGQGNPGSLGSDILAARYDSIRYERRQLAITFSTIARLGYITAPEVKSVVDWLSVNANNGMTFYLLTSILSAFDPVDPQSIGGQLRRKLAIDKSNIAYMKRKLAPTSEWKDNGLKATVLLQWTLFLTDTRHRNPELEHQDGFTTEELETQIWNAVQGDAFTYLAQVVMQFGKGHSNPPISSFLQTLPIPQPEPQDQREVPPDDFKPLVLSAFETLVRLLITHASSELRKIKQRQEDLVLARDRTRTASGLFASSTSPEARAPSSPRNDIAVLYSFIGLLYSSLPPERSLQFWGAGSAHDQRTTYLEYTESAAGRLPTFLQWAVWSTQVHDLTLSTALYDMLSGLSEGQQCSELAHNFMARGTGEVIPGSTLPSSAGGQAVSWSLVFGLLDSWTTVTNTIKAPPPPGPLGTSAFGLSARPPQPHNHPPQPNIGPNEVRLAQAFLRFLSTVVTYSVAVRITISGHPHFRAIPTLVSLIPLGIPLELKGAAFGALAAFCEPGAGRQGVEICKAVWTLMERMEVINVRGGTGPSLGLGLRSVNAVKGVEIELEEVETAHGLYPATIAFLKLLSTLIHTPKRIPLKDRMADMEPILTIPEALGQPYRLPGIGPFTSFVIDNVFLNIPKRDYAIPSDRWQINDLCLCFVERVLASYDLEALVNTADDFRLKEDAITPLLVHPGYDIMKRLLSTTPFQAAVLSYIVDGGGGFEKGLAEDEPYFKSTIVRVLRVIHRVLEIQDIFLDVLLPLLSEFDSTPYVGVVQPRSYFIRLDQALSFGPEYLPALASYVAYPGHSELALLSVKTLTMLSTSGALTNLTTLVEQSSESERILEGYKRILISESDEDPAEAEEASEHYTGAGVPDSDAEIPSLAQAVRLAVLDLFIQNTQTNRPHPNIAHFLLFGSSSNQQQIQDPHALGAQAACIHILLDMVNSGVPRLKEDGRVAGRQHVDPLFVTLPALAERCYRVIFQLCTHSRTCDFVMRYLRTREDFFARQLAVMPPTIPNAWQDPNIRVLYHDGTSVATTVSALGSFLRLRSWIFDLVALDLHLLTQKGHFKSVNELLVILFGSGAYDDSPSWETDISQPFREIGQSHLKIIEFLRGLVFEWSDTLNVQPVDLRFLSQLNLKSCLRVDTNGCEVVDRSALLVLLNDARHALHTQGHVVSPAQNEQLNAEIQYVLESSAVENHRLQITYATAVGYESWRRLLSMVLTKCFDRLPSTQRESTLFDLMQVLPNIIRSPDIQESTAVLLSETVLSSITKLREDRQNDTSGASGTNSLPVERLFVIVRGILDCIIEGGRLELVRGNLYAALINYVYLVTSFKAQFAGLLPSSGSKALSASVSDEDAFAISRRPSSTPSTSLEAGSLALMKHAMDRLISTISRDAIDGAEVWKTVAFMLLDSLVRLSSMEKQNTVLNSLGRHGILANFVRSIRDSDLILQSVLKPDPDDLNPLYVYEAKMSFFVRMSQTKGGAERLLDAQIIPTLSKCDFVDARPEADQQFMDQDTFLPSAVQRYHQLFTPALQVVNGIVATLGARHAAVSNQVLDFLNNHSATIVILIKNEVEDVSLAVVQELQLIVTLCGSVLPSVPRADLASAHSGFGAIHAAILGLSTRCLVHGWWAKNIRPHTDTEILSASVTAPERNSSVFDVTVRHEEHLLRKSTVSYLGTANGFTEPEISPMLSPVTKTSRGEDRRSTFTATIPTVGDALEALEDICTDLSEILKQIADIAVEIDSREHVGLERLQHILPDVDRSVWPDLDVAQKRSLMNRALSRIQTIAKDEAKMLLGTMEMLLLLLWRHIMHYSEGHAVAGDAITVHALRFVSAPEPQVFRNEISRKLGGALQRLESLELAYAFTNDNESQSSQQYIEIMSRRLRDSIESDAS
ncbi:hypothetical protein PC9H_011576 [Pleurotus ostreatus]|uniref:Uncharacterized protein n=1 Tax=Pleurotus ostreatus TaxID=5322 RepID=A0A8H6ZQV8_PLEOS|nr:uncharacterized protein PC9H_011576 [Pleurotus ostreatus]KAF7421056.1 hypothetical protein PC9H_011576 [Pleurotus ostreatus]